MITYGDLFDYLDNACDFKQSEKGNPESITWICDSELTKTKEFCKIHDIDFSVVESRLESTGGYCDCEVLFNSADNILRSEVLKK